MEKLLNCIRGVFIIFAFASIAISAGCDVFAQMSLSFAPMNSSFAPMNSSLAPMNSSLAPMNSSFAL